MSYQHILFALDEHGIALVTVNRPEKLNALSGAVVLELKDAFERIAGDAAIRAAILTGAGEKAFVAGPTSANWPCCRPTRRAHMRRADRRSSALSKRAESPPWPR